MFSRYKIVDVTFTLDTSAYADGDVLADFQDVDGALLRNAGTGYLDSLVLLDKDDQTAGDIDVVFCSDADASLGTENAAVSITDAHAATIVAVVPIAESDWIDLVNSKIVTLGPDRLGNMVKAAAGTTTLRVGLIARSSRTHTASGITARIGVRQG